MTLSPTPLQRLLVALPADLQAEARRRYAGVAAPLQACLAGLYGERADFTDWVGELMEAVGRAMAERSAPLRALDAERLARPDWFTRADMLGYSAYVAQFGGTFAGVVARIPHLRELGVRYLHLLPFLKARAGENDGGFAVASFDEVDPALGSMADLEHLAAALREAGISLCSDFILNHVADDHPWARGAAAGDARLRDYFHVFPDRTMPERFERHLGQVFADAAPGNFTHVAALSGHVWTTFYPFQWDLNYANPAVFTAMVTALLGLANRGIDVFRLDSTAFLWKREGTNCMNQPEVHALLQAIRAIVAIAAPAVLLKAEAIVATADLPAYFGSAAAPECHVAYHSTLMTAAWGALAEQDADLLRKVIAATPPLPPAASWLSYVRCHDDIGWRHLLPEAGGVARLAAIASFYNDGAGFARGVPFQAGAGAGPHATNGTAAALTGCDSAASAQQRADAVRRLLLLHGVALSFGALPVLYMGDELAMANDDAYLADPARAHDSRWVQRAPFDAARHARRHDDGDIAGATFTGLRRLLRLRARHVALAADAPRTVLATDQRALLALARGEHFLALSNFSAQPLAVDLAALGSRGTLALAPWDTQWLDRASGLPLDDDATTTGNQA
jgi:amylosucrase